MLSFLVSAVLTSLVFYNIHQSFTNVSKEWRKFYKHYFIVVSILISIDNVFSIILYRIPYYQFFKLALIGWISIPKGTGPHFIYNVYLKNVHKLFQGDIDAVIANLKKYVDELKAKYYEMVNKTKKGGKIELGFRKNSLDVKSITKNDCADMEVSTTSISEVDEKKEEVNEIIKDQVVEEDKKTE